MLVRTSSRRYVLVRRMVVESGYPSFGCGIAISKHPGLDNRRPDSLRLVSA